MKIILAFLVLSISTWMGDKKPKLKSMTSEEVQLLTDIQNYRASLNLKNIKLSPNLTLVAQAHVEDLIKYPPSGKCNMHSWSGKGKASACCYTDDHKKASCMWDKPRELSNYTDNGYEIAAMSTYDQPNWLEMWQKSRGHHEVIINQGIWKASEWNAIGLAIRPPYAVVWFGKSEDKE